MWIVTVETPTGIQDRPPLILTSLIGVRHIACLVWFVGAEEGAEEWDCWGCSECLRAYCSARSVSDRGVRSKERGSWNDGALPHWKTQETYGL